MLSITPLSPGVLPFSRTSSTGRPEAREQDQGDRAAAFMMLRAYTVYFFPTGSYLKQNIRSAFPTEDAPIFPSDASIRASFRSRGSISTPYRYRETAPPGKGPSSRPVGVLPADFHVAVPDGFREPPDRFGTPVQERPPCVPVRTPGISPCVSFAFARAISGISPGSMLTVTTR